jgi:hypothetical protein
MWSALLIQRREKKASSSCARAKMDFGPEWGSNPERGIPMEKVIILSGECGDDETLAVFIHLLLPQCRVEVVSKGTRAVEIFGVSQPSQKTHKTLIKTEQWGVRLLGTDEKK